MPRKFQPALIKMKKAFLLLFIVSISFTQVVKAQKKTSEDSLEVINAAHRYASGFRLRRKDLAKFKQEHFLPTSDYFKPDRRIPAALTNDSLFVKTYRAKAYDVALDQQDFPGFPSLLPPNHNPPGPPLTAYNTPSQQAAQSDAKNFSFSKAMLTRFKTEHFPETSDYFKPSSATGSSPAMLADSSYVQTFRYEAYNHVYHQRVNPTGHGILIGSITAVGTAIIVIISVALSRVQVY